MPKLRTLNILEYMSSGKVPEVSLLKIICYLLVISSGPLNCQQYNIQTFTINDGLAHNDIRAIAIDSCGFLWLATWDGLSRFDGYSFKNYFHDSEDSLSLPYFSVVDLQVDGGGNLWLLTDNYLLSRYEPENEIFIAYKSLWNNNKGMVKIRVDETGNLWYVSLDSILKYDYVKNKFVLYSKSLKSDKTNLKNTEILDFCLDHNDENSSWIASNDTLYFLERTTDYELIIKHKYPFEPSDKVDKIDFLYNYWGKIHISNTGGLWFFSNFGLFRLDEKTEVVRLQKQNIDWNQFKGTGFFTWSSRKQGIFIYNRDDESLYHLPQEISKLTKSIYAMSKDLIWFSNSSENGASLGLHKVVFTPGYFKHYDLGTNKNDIAQVYAIAKDKYGRLWTGGRGNTPLTVIKNKTDTEKIIFPDYKTQMSPGALRSLTPTEEGMWIGFFKELLLFYDYSNDVMIRHEIKSDGFRPVAIDSTGNLYLVGFRGNRCLFCYSPKDRLILKEIHYSPGSPVYKLFIDKSGILWAGLNSSAVLRYDPSTGESQTFYLLKDNFNVEDICQGDNGELWFALLGGGVCNFDPATGKKVFYTTANGLANNVTYSILKDNSGILWVSTNKGISRINKETGFIKTFGMDEGLNIIEFNSGASFKADNGEFLMGGMGGVVSFFPDSINNAESGNVKQKIIVNEVYVSGKTVKFKRNYNDPDTIILNKGENNFLIFYSSSDFLNSQKTFYRHKLYGIDESWVMTDSRNRSINYSNLSPGWYRLALQATDRNGNWSKEKEIIFRIKPFFYQTIFFRISLPFVLLVLISFMIAIYIRQLKQRESQKQNSLRLQSLRGQMNPHFIFNSLNSINYFISNNDKLSANRYIADFSSIIRSILHNLDYDYITLEKEMLSIEEYLKIEYLRFGDKFDYQIFVDKEIDIESIKVSPGLVQPFIENAIWHGVRGLERRKGKIIVRFEFTDEKLRCTIEDDGIGRKRSESLKGKNELKKSKGISIVLERLKILNSMHKSNHKVSISDLYPERYDTGTVVTIDLPIEVNQGIHHTKRSKFTN